MSRNNPAVSVVVPCYNTARYLRDTVESLTTQTLISKEIILVDDGSQDGTRDVIADLIAKHPSDAIRFIFQDNAGQAAARNRGVSIAQGRYILPLDSDDTIAPNMLEVCAAILDSEPEAGLVYTDREEFGDHAAIVKSGLFELGRLKYFNQLPDLCALPKDDVGGSRWLSG